MDHYNKYLTKQLQTHIHMHCHTHNLVASTWLWPSRRIIHTLWIAHYGALLSSTNKYKYKKQLPARLLSANIISGGHCNDRIEKLSYNGRFARLKR